MMVMLAVTTARAVTSASSITVVAGAESHGMIDACECELEPGGGVAKRASLIASIRKIKGDILLLDAGGFSAGGIYDDYTGGRRADSTRTLVMIKAMGMMKYDVATVGDDDLQYGGRWLAERARTDSLAIVSANCFTAGNKRLFEPYRIINKNGLKIAVAGVTTTEKLFPLDPQVVIHDPVASLHDIWREMAANSDLQIILSHLGQEGSAAVAKAFPDADLVVNGHRKTDKQLSFMVGKVPVLQFSFQGKSLAAITLTRTGKQVVAGAGRWYDVVPELSDDPAVTALLAADKKGAKVEDTYDLYIMSMCQYGMEALHNFMAFLDDVPKITWNLWFIGSISGDTSFSSLHGHDEVIDEMRWLAVKALYPDLWTRFLYRRATFDGTTTDLFKVLAIDLKKINEWVLRNGRKELGNHYHRSTRLSINASPTLLVNNRPFGRAIVKGNLLRYHCAIDSATSKPCSSLPECAEDEDCRAPGKLGKCVKGVCERRDAVPFVFTVVVADSTMTHPENKVIGTTRDLFPGADIRTVSGFSVRGRELIKKYNVTKLPFYLFGREVSLTHNYSSIQNGLVNFDGAYTFDNGIVPTNYDLQRKKAAGKLVLFVDPFFPGLSDILAIFAADTLLQKRCAIEPVIFKDPQSVKPGTEESFRQEEALRWIALGMVSNKAKMEYLTSYGSSPGSSYWNRHLAATGISPDSLFRKVQQSGGALKTLWKNIASLSIGDPAVLLIDNVETAPLNGERELRRMLSLRAR
jgi:hypothetical protein